MQKNLHQPLPEIVFGTADQRESRRISRLVQAGQLRRIASKVYTPNLDEASEAIVSRNLFVILGHLFPGAVISHRSAFESRPTPEGDIFLTYKYARKVELPGVTVRLLKGSRALQGDTPFMQGLYMASRPRALLENMQVSRSHDGSSKCLPRESIEDQLDQICRIQGVEALNQVRDEARALAAETGMAKAFENLDRLIGAVQGTREAGRLLSATARARARGEPLDSGRLELFNTLHAALRQEVLPRRLTTVASPDAIRNLAFFESYFSNYIEGTEFEISEARAIVLDGRPVLDRPADAHDIVGTFNLVSNHQEMKRCPGSIDEFHELLRARHAVLMVGRPDGNPGSYKEKPNRVGETLFVAPELVRGTLAKGFEIYRSLEEPLARAIFMMMAVTEVHPFSDGNGRVARIMMNAELVTAGHCRIIVPTVYREDYMLALRAFSRQRNPTPCVRMLDRAQDFTARLDFSNYDQVLTVLTQCQAFRESGECRLRMP